MIRDAIQKELEQIPEAKLAEIYDIIHYFRLGLQSEQKENPTMGLAGSWSDLSEDQFQSFVDEVKTRRSQAFSRRPVRETGAD